MMARATTGRKSFIERARREQIVDAAIDVLYESGFAAASLGAIAEPTPTAARSSRSRRS